MTTTTYNRNNDFLDTGFGGTPPQTPQVSPQTQPSSQPSFQDYNKEDLYNYLFSNNTPSDQYKFSTPLKTPLSGTERYNDPVYGYDPFNPNLEYQYGDRQSGLSKLFNTVVKTGANLVGGLVETLASIPLAVDAAVSGDASKLYDNPVFNNTQDWLTSLETKLPNYTSTFEKNHPILSYIPGFAGIGTLSNSWGKVLKNVAYMGGAIAGSAIQDAGIAAVTGGLGEAPLIGPQIMRIMGRFGKAFGTTEGIESVANDIKTASNTFNDTEGAGLTFNTGATTTEAQGFQRTEDLVNSVNKAATTTNIINKFRYGTSLVTSSLGGSAIMANQTYSNIKDALTKDFTDKYGRDPNQDEQAQIEDYAKGGGNADLFANMALLTFTEANMYGNLFKPVEMAKKAASAELARSIPVALEGTGTEAVFKQVEQGAKGFDLIKNKITNPTGVFRTIGYGAFQMGAQIVAGKTAEDYYQRKFDNPNDTNNFMLSMGTALRDTFNTQDGLENVFIGALAGGIVHVGKNLLERYQGIDTNKKAVINSSLAWLNSERIGGLFGDTYDAAVTSDSIAKDMQDAARSGNAFDYKNLQFQQLYNLVDSGVKSNRFDLRLDQLNMLKELPQKEFESMFKLSYNDQNRRIASDYIDSVTTKALDIKSNIDKVNDLFQNPYSAKSKDADEVRNHFVFEDYKSQLALDLSSLKDNQRRISQISEDVSKITPLTDQDKLRKLVSEQGIQETIQDFNNRTAELNKSQEIFKDNKDSKEYQNYQKEKDFLKQKTEELNKQLDNYDPVTYNKTAEDIINYYQNGGVDFKARISPIDVKDLLQKAQDSYKLINQTDRALYHYQSLVSKNGFDDYMNKVSQAHKQAAQTFENSNIGKRILGTDQATQPAAPVETKADEAPVDKKGNLVDTEKAAAEQQTSLEAKKADIEKRRQEEQSAVSPTDDMTARGVINDKYDKQLEDLNKETKPLDERIQDINNQRDKALAGITETTENGKPSFSNKEENMKAYSRKIVEDGINKKYNKLIKQEEENEDYESILSLPEPLTTDEVYPFDLEEITPEEVDKQQKASELKGAAKSTLYQNFAPLDNFNKVYQPKKEGLPYDHNLRDSLFSQSDKDLYNKLTISISESTEGMKYEDIKPFPGFKDIYYRGYKHNIEIQADGKPIGFLRPSDSLMFERKGEKLPISEILPEEYEKVTRNAPETYDDFIKEVKSYSEIADKIVEDFKTGKKEYSNEEVKNLFDTVVRYGNPDQSDRESTSTLIKDLKYRSPGDAILSLPTIYDKETKGFARTKDPVIINEKELSPEDFSNLNKFIDDNIDTLRGLDKKGLNSRYFYIFKLPNGRYEESSIVVARPSKVSPETLENIFGLIKSITPGAKVADIRKANITLKDSLYIASSKDFKGNKTNISLEFNSKGGLYMKIVNPARDFRKAYFIETKDLRNFDDLTQALNKKLYEKYNDDKLASLKIHLNKEDFKNSVLPDELTTTKDLEDKLKLSVLPNPFKNYKLFVLPKSAETKAEKPLTAETSKSKYTEGYIQQEEGMKLSRWGNTNYFKETPSDPWAHSSLRESLRKVNIDDISYSEKPVENKLKKLGAYKQPEYNKYSTDYPIAIEHNGKITLLDGHHRIELAKRAGEKTIEVAVKNVDSLYNESSTNPQSANKSEEAKTESKEVLTPTESKIIDAVKNNTELAEKPEGSQGKILYDAAQNPDTQKDVINTLVDQSNDEKALEASVGKQVVKAVKELGQKSNIKPPQEQIKERWQTPIEPGSKNYWGHLSEIQLAFVNHKYDELLDKEQMSEQQLKDIVSSTKSKENEGLPQSLVEDAMFRVGNQDLINSIDYWQTKPKVEDKGYVNYVKTIKEVLRNGQFLDAVNKELITPQEAKDILEASGLENKPVSDAIGAKIKAQAKDDELIKEADTKAENEPENEPQQPPEPQVVQKYEKGEPVIYRGKQYTVKDIEPTTSGDSLYVISDGTKYGDRPVRATDLQKLRDESFTDKEMLKEVTPLSFKETPDELDEQDNKLLNFVGLKTLLERLYNKFDIPYKIIEGDNTWKGRFKDGVVLINGNNYDNTTPFHEYLHPFIVVMKADNPDLYRNLIEEFKNNPYGKEIINEVKEIPFYKNSTAEEIGDESLVRYISKAASENVNSEGRRVRNKFYAAMKSLIDRFRSWLSGALKNLGFEGGAMVGKVKGIPESASLQDVADLVSLHDMKFNMKEQSDLINALDLSQREASKTLADEDRIINKLSHNLRILEHTAKTRLPSDELLSNVITVRSILKDADQLGSLDRYLSAGIGALRYANDEFRRVTGIIKNPENPLSKQDITDLSKSMGVIKNLISFYKDDVDYLLKGMARGMDGEEYFDYLKVIHNADNTIASIKSRTADILTELLYPDFQEAHRLNTKHPEFKLTKEQFKNKLYSADQDINGVTFALGAISTSRDPINATTHAYIKGIYEDSFIDYADTGTAIKVAYDKFLKDNRLGNNREHTIDYYKNNYLRKASVLEKTGEDEEGRPISDYKSYWAYHQKYYHDLYDKARTDYMESIGFDPENQSHVDKLIEWEKQNTQQENGEVVPADKYLNPDFQKLYEKDPFFTSLYNIYDEANNKLGGEERLKYGMVPQKSLGKNAFADFKGKTPVEAAKTLGGKILNFILPKDTEQARINEQAKELESQKQKQLQAVEQAGLTPDEYNAKRQEIEDDYNEKISKLSGSDNISQNLDGTYYRKISAPFTRPLTDEDLDLALPDTLLDFYDSVNKTNALREAEPNVALLRSLIEGGSEFIPESEIRKVLKRTSKGNLIFDRIANRPADKERVAKRLNRQLQHFLQVAVYNDTKDKATLDLFGFRQIDLNKLGDNMAFLTSLETMAGNFTASLSHLAIVETNAFSEGLGKKFWNTKDWLYAKSEYVKNIPEFFADLTRLKKSIYTQLGIKYDIIQGDFRDGWGKKITGSLMQRFANGSSVFFLTHGIVHEMQMCAAISLMRHTPVKLLNGETINLLQAHELNKDGYLRVRNDAVWTKEDDKSFTGRINGITQYMNGIYNPFDKVYAQRLWYGRAALIFRKHFYSALKARWGKPYYDVQVKDRMGGIYRDFFTKLFSDIQEYKAGAATKFFTKEGWNEDERYAWNRSVFELGLFASTIILGTAIARGESGDSKDKPWGQQYLNLLMLRLRANLGQYNVLGAVDAINMLKNPAASLGILDKVGAFLGQLVTDPFQQYKQKSGSFNKGSSELFAKFSKLIPFYNQWVKLKSPDEQSKFYKFIQK